MSTLREIQLLLEKQKYKGAAIIGLSVFALVCAGIALLLAGLQYGEVNSHVYPYYVKASMPMPPSPYAFYLGKDSGATIELTLSSDLSSYVGKVYRVWSLSDKPHRVISGSATFDGGNHIATFGGAIGDGMVFEVISGTRIAMISSTGVTLS